MLNTTINLDTDFRENVFKTKGQLDNEHKS